MNFEDMNRLILEPKERKLEDRCPECGKQELVLTHAYGWGSWGGNVRCEACSFRSSAPAYLASKMVTVEPLPEDE